MKQLTAISLFSGAVDGLAIAARAAGIHVTHHVEWDAWCCRVLRMNHPNSIVLNKDIHDVHELPPADIIFGGSPCQGWSAAGSRKGFDDPRYLWPEMLRIVRANYPRIVIHENVRGGVSSGLLDRISDDLEDSGYKTTALVFPANVFGAPHERYRMFIVGLMVNPIGSGRGKYDIPRIAGDSGHADRRPDATVGNPVSRGAARSQDELESIIGADDGRGAPLRTTDPTEAKRTSLLLSGEGFSGQIGAISQPRLGRTADGLASGLHRFDPLTAFPGFPAGQGVYQHAYEPPRTTPTKGEYANDRIQALGNAVVWQQAAPVFRTAVKWLAVNS